MSDGVMSPVNELRDNAQDIGQLDVSARAGLLLAAYAAGSSTQPNLLTRGTIDQGLITGIATVASYGWGTSAHSFLRSVANRLPVGSPIMAGLVVDGVTAATAYAGYRALAYRRNEPWQRSLGRLGFQMTAAAATAGVGADVLENSHGRWRRGLGLAAMGAVGVAAWARTKSGRAQVGSLLQDGTYFEDSTRSIAPAKAAALTAVTGGFVYGLSHLESTLSTVMSKAAARALGGDPEDHRTLGRVGATTTSYGLAWLGLSAVVAKLTAAGSEVETANMVQPTLPEVTGSPASGIPWSVQSREGTRWLSAVLLEGHIADVMGEDAKQPIRVYASLDAADTPEARADLLLRELDRTNAWERDSIALFSPTGSGYVNYVACETYEYLSRGNCASMAIEYSVLPSALSLTRTGMGTRQTALVVDQITERLLTIPADRRPKFYLFGESLGCKVSQEMFTGASDASLRGAGIEAAVFVGTPAFTRWRSEVWGGRPVDVAPQVGPGAIYLPRAIPDWTDLPAEQKQHVKYLLLQNGDDPIPKFGPPLLWRQPEWLGPDDTRPRGAPKGTNWQPVTTFVATFTDMLNALTPTPGVFAEGGHDYRVEIPEAIRQVWGLSATDEQMKNVQSVLRTRELAWEVKRDWDSAHALTADKQSEALDKVRQKVGVWTGQSGPADDSTIAMIIRGTEPV